MTLRPVDHPGTLPGGGLRPSAAGSADACPQGFGVYSFVDAGNAWAILRRGTRGVAAKGIGLLAGEWRMDGGQAAPGWTERRADLRSGGAPPGT